MWWFLNDGGSASNVQFETTDLALWPRVVVTWPIRPGEELLVIYGDGYYDRYAGYTWNKSRATIVFHGDV